MASPPPLPAHHGHGGRYDTRTPSRQNIHDDLADRLAGLGVRDAARSPSSRTTRSSFSVSPNKNYLFFSFKRDGPDWYDARRQELSVPQNDLKKRADKGNSKVLGQMTKMSNARRQHIDELLAELDSQEAEGLYWEPAYIDDTDKVRDRRGVVKAKGFELIVARRSRAALPTKPEGKSATKDNSPKGAAEKKPVPILNVNTSLPKGNKKNPYMDDPFSSTQLFAHDGVPMDAQGAIPFENAGLPEYIRPDRPIAQGHRQEQPTIEPAIVEPLLGLGGPLDGPLDFDGVLGRLHAGEPGAILDVGNHRSSGDAAQGRSGRRRPRSSSRRRSSAHRLNEVRFETRSPEEPRYASSRSSWGTDDASVISGELEEMSSRTSNESVHSYRSPRKYVINPPYHHDRSPRSSKYYNIDRIVTPGSRRRQPAAIEPPPKHKSPSPRPIVHQQQPPQHQYQHVPPTAEYPTYYEDREREREQGVDDYIRNSGREADRRAHEEELSRREREVRLREIQAQEQEPRRSMFSSGGNFAPVGSRKYSFDPRNQYA